MAQAPSNRVFYSIPLGIPDPSEEYLGDKPDTRRRVKCTTEVYEPYFLLIDRIRIHIGCHPNNNNHPQKQFEARYLHYQKGTCLLDPGEDHCLVPNEDLQDEGMCNILRSITLENVTRTSMGVLIGKCSEFMTYLPKLTAQFRNQRHFDNCLKYVFVMGSRTQGFLQANGVDAKVEYKKLQPILRGGAWDKQNRASQAAFEKVLEFRTIVNSFGLRPTGWNRESSFDQFAATLKTKGPLVVCGAFGKTVFGKPSMLHHMLEGHPLYGWESFPKEQPQNDGTFILIMGCERRQKEEDVYFVEGDECTDPSTPPRIYMMSYERLVTYVEPNLPEVEGDKVVEIYGYHGPSQPVLKDNERKEN